MSFLEKMCKLAEHITNSKQYVNIEEDSKQYLVQPFIQALGYNPFDPTEVQREYNPEMAHAGQTKADYMILKDGRSIVAIECKNLGHVLGTKEIGQLADYFTYSDAQIGILTDGVKYMFFADTKKTNVMDERPFFVFDLNGFEDDAVGIMEWLTKSSFAPDLMVDAAQEYQEEIDKRMPLIPSPAVEIEKEVRESMQAKRSECAEPPKDQLHRIIKEILQTTQIRQDLIRMGEKDMLSVHLHDNLLKGTRTTRFMRLIPRASGYSLQLTDIGPCASGGWERVNMKLIRYAMVKTINDLHHHKDKLREMATRFYA